MKIRILALTGLFAALILSACGGAATPMPEATEAEDPGVTAIVAEGRLVPEQHVDIAFRASGQVKQVLVAEGDTVSEGEVIALLDDTDQQQAVNKAQLAVEQAQISVANAQHNLDVVVGWSPNKGQLNAAQANLANAEAAVKAAQSAYDKVAYDPSVSSTAQSLALEQATNNLNKAKADVTYIASSRPDVIAAKNALDAVNLALDAVQLDLERAKNELDKMSLKAPFAGTVTRLNVNPGAPVSAGLPVATVADLKAWVIETDNLTELEVIHVKVGQKVTITFDALPDKIFHGEVLRVASQYEEKRGDITYTVTIALTDADPDLRWGMTATVEFPK